jgi:uncharacterized damage-inducible protein DinB
MSQRAQTELLYGKGAHTNPLACIEDVSAELASRPAAGSPHSIAQLVFHMNYWMDYELRRIRGQRPPYPEHNAESFPIPTVIDEQQWGDLKKTFASMLSEFTALTKSSPEELQRQIESGHPGDANQSTLEGVIWQMVAHNSYHTGQIVLIRRAHGAWPPESGGDTWQARVGGLCGADTPVRLPALPLPHRSLTDMARVRKMKRRGKSFQILNDRPDHLALPHCGKAWRWRHGGGLQG